MLTPDELKKHAFRRKLKQLEQIWLDYTQDHTLYLLYRRHPNLTFRGGTCIWKIYGGDRFSEDLDMQLDSLPNGTATYLKKELELLGFSIEILKDRKTSNTHRIRLGFQRPGSTQTTPLSVEILKSADKAETVDKELHSPYPDVSKIDTNALSMDRLAEEKLITICGRNRPRDIYDLYFLIGKGAKPDLKNIRKEVPEFDSKLLRQKLREKEGKWKSLEPLLTTSLPGFRKVMNQIMKAVKT